MRALTSMGDRVQVVAGVDVDRSRVEAFCAEHGIPRAYTDAGAMLTAEQPDLVHIATPPGTHYDLIMAGLAAGDWVGCEHPLCTSLAELVRFENGALGSIVNSVLSPRQETYLRFDFQRATVELQGLYGYANKDWRYSLPDGASDEVALSRWREIPHAQPSGHAAQLRALLD